LPFDIWRIDHRVSYQGDLRKFKKSLMHYFRENFYVTTSGNFRTQALNATLSEIGKDRVLFSVDYPYESMYEAAAWFDGASISDNTRAKIGRSNAQRIFGLSLLDSEASRRRSA
jgi:gamma-resorcylate decarboxylase